MKLINIIELMKVSLTLQLEELSEKGSSTKFDGESKDFFIMGSLRKYDKRKVVLIDTNSKGLKIYISKEDDKKW